MAVNRLAADVQQCTGLLDTSVFNPEDNQFITRLMLSRFTDDVYGFQTEWGTVGLSI